MAAPNSAVSKKAAKAGAKKIPIAKKIVLKAPATSAKASKAASLKALKSPTLKTLKSPTLKTMKTPAMKALKTPAVKSKKNPAVVKKASPLRKIGDKAIKKTTGKKAKQMMIKGGLGGAKNNLEGGAKASAGGVAAFDLEAFVKVKFSELEKTAHQKKVSQMLLSQFHFNVSERVWADQQHSGRAEQVQHAGGERALQCEEGGQP